VPNAFDTAYHGKVAMTPSVSAPRPPLSGAPLTVTDPVPV